MHWASDVAHFEELLSILAFFKMVHFKSEMAGLPVFIYFNAKSYVETLELCERLSLWQSSCFETLSTSLGSTAAV